MRLERLLWLFPIALTLHNLEEAIWFPAWSQHGGFWERPIGATEFRIAAVLLTILAFAITFWSVRTSGSAHDLYVGRFLVRHPLECDFPRGGYRWSSGICSRGCHGSADQP